MAPTSKKKRFPFVWKPQPKGNKSSHLVQLTFAEKSCTSHCTSNILMKTDLTSRSFSVPDSSVWTDDGRCKIYLHCSCETTAITTATEKKKIVKYSSHSQPKRNISSLYFSLASSKVGFDLLTWIFCACVNAHFTPPQMSVLWSHKQY